MTRRFPLLLLTIALTLTGVLAASAPAGAAQLDLVGGSSFRSPSLYQHWVDDSYAPTFPGVVQLTLSPGLLVCGTVAGAVGCTDWSEWPVPRVEVDTGNGAYQTHEYLMHELGHVFDATEMQDPFRADFMAIWGLPGGVSAWTTQFGANPGSAGEWFAESYKLCALYGPQMPYQVWMTDSPTYGFPGDRRSGKEDASCRLILHVGAAAGLPTAASPTLYAPRVLVRGDRKVAQCRGTDLLQLGRQVRCERAGGGNPAGRWHDVLQTRHMSKAQLRRVQLTFANARPAFVLLRR